VIERPAHLERLRLLLREFPVVGLIGARQIGKTTLAGALGAGFEGEVTRFDLEELVVIHAGPESYPLAPRIRAVPLARLRQDVAALG
jgi:predicted AAA+ superfamily ATPase